MELAQPKLIVLVNYFNLLTLGVLAWIREEDFKLYIMVSYGEYGNLGMTGYFGAYSLHHGGEWNTLNHWCIYGLNVGDRIFHVTRWIGIILHFLWCNFFFCSCTLLFAFPFCPYLASCFVWVLLMKWLFKKKTYNNFVT